MSVRARRVTWRVARRVAWLGARLAAAVVLAGYGVGGRASATSLADAQAAYDGARFAAARTMWSTLAEAGDPQAALNLGTLFERGDGVKADPALAYCWYRRAAAGGQPAAAFNVGVMHDSGRGAAQDANQAAIWYGRAAAFGFRRAEFNLGQLYEAGEGVPRNTDMAAAWFRLADEAGLPAAGERLARLARAPQPDAAALPRAVSLDKPADIGGDTAEGPEKLVPLTWNAVAQTLPVTYYVEVVATDMASSRPAFSASTAMSAMLATLPPGRYAGRVFTVAAQAAHYAIGGWTRFSVAPPNTGPVACGPR